MHKLSKDKYETNNFFLVQKNIDNYFYNFIHKKKIQPENNIGYKNIPYQKFVHRLNNMVKFRNSFYNRNDYSRTILSIVSSINKISNIEELSYVVNDLNNFGIFTLFTIEVCSHFREPDVYVLSLGEINTQLDDSTNKEKIKEYVEFLKDIHHLVTNKWNYGSDKYQFIKNILTFQILFSKPNLKFPESKDPKILFNSTTYQNFLEKYEVSNFWKNNISKYLDKFDNKHSIYVMYENETSLIFFKKFLSNMTTEYLSMTKDYLVYCLAEYFGPYLADEKKLSIETFYETFGMCILFCHC